MKIAYVITGLGLGGAEKQVIDIATRVQQKGHEVIIISLSNECDILPETNAIAVYRINADKTIFSIFSILQKLRKILHAFNPDIVHSHMYHANIIVRLYKAIFNRKAVVISTAHSTNEGGWLRMVAYRVTNTFANLSTNVSEEATKKFIRLKAFGGKKTLTVYNGIDTSKFFFDLDTRIKKRKELGLKECETVILNVGRLTPAKNQTVLIDAFSVLAKDNPKLHLLIVGDGDLKIPLKKQIENYQLEDKITLLGKRTDIHELMCAADIFALSSAWEGLPLVLAEAMASKLLVVATDAGGVTEIVDRFGYITDSKNLAYTIQESLNLSQEVKSLIVQKAQERIKLLFCIDKITDTWINIYRGLRNVDK